jgi:hypothetical protein
MNAHSLVIDALEDLVEDYRDYDDSEIHLGEDFPYPALIPTGKSSHLSLRYKPDLWVKWQAKKRYDIYEVWDNETEEKAVFEILRVAYTPWVKYYSIICISDSWRAKDAKKYAQAILGNLKEPNVTYDRDVSITEVDRNRTNLRFFLRSKLAKDLEFSQETRIRRC